MSIPGESTPSSSNRTYRISEFDERTRALAALESSPTPNPLAMSSSISMDQLPNSRPARPLSMWSYSTNTPNNLTGATPPNLSRHLTSASPNPKRSTRWTVIILPPACLPHSPPPAQVSGFAHGYGASGRYSGGILIPLQPTLTLQLASIAREFSLPSTGGLTLHLNVDSYSPGGAPRIADDTWLVLFGWAFDEQASNLASNYSNPPTGLLSSLGLPVAARLEFDIDLRKARWYESWASAPQQQHQSQLSTSSFLPNAHRNSLASTSRDPPKSLHLSSQTSRRGSDATGAHTIGASRSNTLSSGGDPRSSLRNLIVTSSDDHKTIDGEEDSSRSLQSASSATQPPHSSPDEIYSHDQHQESNSTHQSNSDIIKLEKIEEDKIFDHDVRSVDQDTLNMTNEPNHARPKSSSGSETSSGHQSYRSPTAKTAQVEEQTESSSVVSHHDHQLPPSIPDSNPKLSNTDEQDNDTRSISTSHSTESQPVSQSQLEEEDQNLISDEASRQMLEAMNAAEAERIESEKQRLEKQKAEAEAKKQAELAEEARIAAQLKLEEEERQKAIELAEKERVAAEERQKAIELAEKERAAAEQRAKMESEQLKAKQLKEQAEVAKVSANSQTQVVKSVERVEEAGSKAETNGAVPMELHDNADPADPSTTTTTQSEVETSAPAVRSFNLLRKSSISSAASSIRRFSGENIFSRRQSQAAKDEEEAQKLVEEMNRLVLENAKTSDTAQLAPIAPTNTRPSSPSSQSARSLVVKESPREPPPAPTRSKVMMLAKAFDEAHSPTFSPPLLSHKPRSRSSMSSILTSDSAIPPVPLVDEIPSKTNPTDPLAPILYEYKSNDKLSEDLADFIVQAQDDALARHQTFVLALSGGSLPKLMASGLLNKTGVKWDAWKVFFADERVVPLDHPDSNFSACMDALFSKVPIERSQITTIMGLPPNGMDLDEISPDIASIYEAQILDEIPPEPDHPRFDLILLGMGDDGHTCSLFPNHPLLDSNTIVTWLNDSPKLPPHRITLSLPVLNSAHKLAFVCTGAGKQKMLADVLTQKSSPSHPASLVKLKDGPVSWFVDAAAANGGSYTQSLYKNRSSAQTVGNSSSSRTGSSTGTHSNKTESVDSSSKFSTGPAGGSLKDSELVKPGDSENDHWDQEAYVSHRHSNSVEEPNDSTLDQSASITLSIDTDFTQQADERNMVSPGAETKLAPSPMIAEPVLVLHELEEHDQNSTLNSLPAIQRTSSVSTHSSSTNTRSMKILDPVSSTSDSQSSSFHSKESSAVVMASPEMYSSAMVADDLSSEDVSGLSRSSSVEDMKPPSSSIVQINVDVQRWPEFDSRNSKSHNMMEYPNNLYQVYPALYPSMVIYPVTASPMAKPENGPSSSIIQETRMIEIEQKQSTHIPRHVPNPVHTLLPNTNKAIAYQSPPTEPYPILPSDLDQQENDHRTQPSTLFVRSPLDVHQSNLSDMFHSAHPAHVNSSSDRSLNPSVSSDQHSRDPSPSSNLEHVPIGLQMQSSTLDPSFYGQSQNRAELTPPAVKRYLPLSPVVVQQSYLPDFFYPTTKSSSSSTNPVPISPSVPYSQRPGITALGLTSESLIPIGATTQASTLGASFYGDSSSHDQVEESRGLPDSTLRDSSSQNACAVSSTADSSDATPMHLTDNESVSSPRSPDRLPSADLMDRMIHSPTSGMIKGGLIESQAAAFHSNFKAPQHEDLEPEHQLMEHDDSIKVVSLADASIMSPSIADYHEKAEPSLTADEASHRSSSPISETTPKPACTSVLGPIDHLETSERSIEPTQPDESADCNIAPAQPQSPASHSDLTAEYSTRNSLISVDDEIQQIPLNEISDITPSIAEFHKTDMDLQENGPREVKEEIDESQDLDFEPCSPDRLPSADLMGRLRLSPSSDSFPEKQFSEYAPSTVEGSRRNQALLEPDNHCMVTKLSEASIISPSIAQFHRLPKSPSEESADSKPNGVDVPNDEALSLSDQPVGGDSKSPAESTKSIAVAEEHESTRTNGDVAPFHLQPTSVPQSACPSSAGSTSPIYAISTDQVGPLASAKRQPITDENHRLSLTASHRMSWLRTSPTPPLGATLSNDPEVSPMLKNIGASALQGQIPNPETQSEDDNDSHSGTGNLVDFDLDRLRDITGHSLSTPMGTSENGDSVKDWIPEVIPLVDSGIRPHEAGVSINPTDPIQGPSGGDLTEDLEILDHRVASETLLNQIPIDQVHSTALPPPPPPILFPFADEEEISEALAQFVFEAQEAAFQRQRRFRIALSGESLSQIVGAGIVGDDRMQWEHWEVFFVDEALVSIHSPESTFCQFNEAILKHVPIPIEQVHTINRFSEAQIEEAIKTVDGSDRMTDELADIYEQDLLKVFPEADMEAEDESQLIKPRFDLILLQLGKDGHIGSLLPNHPLLGESNWYVAWLGDSPVKPTHRITFTLPLLNSAHQIALIGLGEERSMVLADALNRSIQSDVPMEEDRINPAALLKTDRRPVVWFADSLACQLSNYPQSRFWDEEEEEGG